MPKKYTLEEVSKAFASSDCKLLSATYINFTHPLAYICSCGNESLISFANFQKGKRCNLCKSEKISSALRKNFEDIQTFFKNHNYTLLCSKSEYKKSSQPLDCLCPQGHATKISWNNFSRGKRCGDCFRSFHPTYETVKKYFEEHGCTLLEKHFSNTTSLLQYICSCGTESEITFSHFKQEHRCRACGKEKSASAKRSDFSKIKDAFSSRGFRVLEKTFRNNKTPMLVQCPKGHSLKMTWDNFQAGNGCRECSGGMPKTLDEVKELFAREGFLLESASYKNTFQPLLCVCPNGHRIRLSRNNFLAGQR